MTPANIPDAGQLLGIVRTLSLELRPGANGLEHLGLDHALERDFGLDSLARVELMARIERELGTRLGEAAFVEAETPRDLLRRMEATAPDIPAPETWTPAETPAPAGSERPPETIDTLVGLLDWHVERHGERVHITLQGEDDRFDDISYRGLKTEALALASGLLAQGANAGDRIALMLPTGRDFFAAFYGALYAGCVPVPLYPPARPALIEEHMRRIAGIVINAEAALFVTDERTRLLGRLLRAQCPSLRDVSTVAALLSDPTTLPSRPDAPFSKTGADDIAFLQYTSGSTGNPKGVVLTHANLLANLRAMEQASGITSADVFVSWLPLYHDMGLIGACLGSLCVGFRLVLMSPLAFLARPKRWLWTIHRYRATVSAAPNFAYDLCAARLPDNDLDGLDLRCWRLAYNGAEPVSPDTIERFAARFAPHGFRRESMTPVYGLAESSVGLAFPPHRRGPLIDRVDRDALISKGIARPVPAEDRHARRVVSCGAPLPGHALRIVDAEGSELPNRTQGRVQFRGPSATRGYFRNPEATERLVAGDWLNTGDLGYLAAGELYLTGREKDIIIRAGHNIHPQELEEAANQVEGVRRGGVAVFPASDPRTGTERLVVLAETRAQSAAERARIEAEIGRLAVDLTGIPADDIVLAPPRTVLKTSSGKIRRAACRERYERGELLSGTRRAPWRQMLRLGLDGALTRTRSTAWSLWAWAVFTVVVPFAWLLIVLSPTLAMRRKIARASAHLALAATGLAPRLDGLDRLSGDAPAIVVANHASYLDSLILAAVLPPRFAYVAKQELLEKPLAALPLRRLSCAFVERFDSARGIEDTRAMESRVRAGESLVFFPEGTFREKPGLLPFRLGAFMAAARTGTPVIPLALTGTRALLPGETLRPRHAALRVQVGEPIRARGEDWRSALQLRDAARGWILARQGEADAAI